MNSMSNGRKRRITFSRMMTSQVSLDNHMRIPCFAMLQTSPGSDDCRTPSYRGETGKNSFNAALPRPADDIPPCLQFLHRRRVKFAKTVQRLTEKKGNCGGPTYRGINTTSTSTNFELRIRQPQSTEPSHPEHKILHWVMFKTSGCVPTFHSDRQGDS